MLPDRPSVRVSCTAEERELENGDAISSLCCQKFFFGGVVVWVRHSYSPGLVTGIGSRVVATDSFDVRGVEMAAIFDAIRPAHT